MKTKSCPKLTVICHLVSLSSDVFRCFDGVLHVPQVSGACEDLTSQTIGLIITKQLLIAHCTGKCGQIITQLMLYPCDPETQEGGGASTAYPL